MEALSGLERARAKIQVKTGQIQSPRLALVAHAYLPGPH